jgi:hypothetical protein
MKAAALLVILLAGLAFIAGNLCADDVKPASPPAPEQKAPPKDQPAAGKAPGGDPAKPEGLPYDGAVNARDAEIKDFFDALGALEAKAAALRKAVTGAPTAEQKAQAKTIADELDSFLKARQAFRNRWTDWLEYTDYSGGLPNDNVARFGYIGNQFAIGDFNEDGKPDLAAIAYDGDGFYAWLNNGDGTWKESRKNLNNQKTAGGIVVAGDFNGDKHVDLLFAPSSGALQLYQGDGKGDWAPMPIDPPAPGVTTTYKHIECTDIDGDGDTDIIMNIQESGHAPNGAAMPPRLILVLLENDGTGKFTRKDMTMPPEINQQTMQDFRLVDIDNDRKLELVSPIIHHELQNGRPVEPGTLVIMKYDGEAKWSMYPQRPPIPKDASVDMVMCRDLNGDGFPDIVLVTHLGMGPMGGVTNGTVNVLINDGKGQFKQVPIDMKPILISAVDIADVNSDGNLDLVLLGQRDGKARIVLGDGKGGFKDSPSSGVPEMSAWGTYMKVCDMDGDGAPDIVACYSSAAIGAAMVAENAKTFHVWRNASVHGRIEVKVKQIRGTLDGIK